MSRTGRVITKVYPAQETRLEERLCDVCGQDATGLTPCCVCKKDLCPEHLIAVSEVYRRSWGPPGIFSRVGQEVNRGVLGRPGCQNFCKACLLKTIEEEL